MTKSKNYRSKPSKIHRNHKLQTLTASSNSKIQINNNNYSRTQHNINKYFQLKHNRILIKKSGTNKKFLDRIT